MCHSMKVCHLVKLILGQSLTLTSILVHFTLLGNAVRSGRGKTAALYSKNPILALRHLLIQENKVVSRDDGRTR